MFDFLGGLLGQARDFIGGISERFFGDDDEYSRIPVTLFDLNFDRALAGGSPVPELGQLEPAPPAIGAPQDRTINVPLDPEGRIIFTPDPALPGEATFEPDPLGIPDTGTAEEKRTAKEEEEMPIHQRILGTLGPILSGASAFALGDLIGTSIGGTQMGPAAPATTPGIGATADWPWFPDAGADLSLGSAQPGLNGNAAPTAAQVRQLLLRKVGLRAGRRGPVPYSTFRRIIRDMGEVAGAQCMGLNASEVCFLYMNAPKRRGRSITPKQINRSMSALRRVKALNKSVRKALPGCKI